MSWIVEIVPRLVPHLALLKSNPDMMILIGCDSKPSKELTRAGHQHMLMAIQPLLQLLEINMSRLVVSLGSW
jgi:hypothetical protein